MEKREGSEKDPAKRVLGPAEKAIAVIIGIGAVTQGVEALINLIQRFFG